MRPVPLRKPAPHTRLMRRPTNENERLKCLFVRVFVRGAANEGERMTRRTANERIKRRAAHERITRRATNKRLKRRATNEGGGLERRVANETEGMKRHAAHKRLTRRATDENEQLPRRAAHERGKG
ncbi:hypothetical protein T484DRAFT_1839834, partial [Baffinella frigidus]